MKLPRKLESTKEALNATGDAPIYAARAWCSWNMQGTQAIRASGGVSSIADAGVGLTRINFTVAAPSITSYCAVFSANVVASYSHVSDIPIIPASASYHIVEHVEAASDTDASYCNAVYYW